jgi:hypothetical protein
VERFKTNDIGLSSYLLQRIMDNDTVAGCKIPVGKSPIGEKKSCQ